MTLNIDEVNRMPGHLFVGGPFHGQRGDPLMSYNARPGDKLVCWDKTEETVVTYIRLNDGTYLYQPVVGEL